MVCSSMIATDAYTVYTVLVEFKMIQDQMSSLSSDMQGMNVMIYRYLHHLISMCCISDVVSILATKVDRDLSLDKFIDSHQKMIDIHGTLTKQSVMPVVTVVANGYHPAQVHLCLRKHASHIITCLLLCIGAHEDSPNAV